MKKLSLFAIGMVGYFSALAQLSAGEIMFVGALYDGNDGFSILALADIPASTTIYFSDRTWDGSAFDTGSQNSMTWGSGGSIIPAGTVITFEDTKNAPTATAGSTPSGLIKLNNSGDVVYCFLGSNDVTPTTFLSAFSNEDIESNGGSLVGTGLTAGVNVVEFTDTNHSDVLVYNSSTTCNGTVAECAAEIADPTNWSVDDDNGNGFPDFPDDVPTAFSGSALPVELLVFRWVALNGSVELNWQTASEVNNKGFHVQKSVTGEYFTDLAFVEGNGTTSKVSTYSYKDPLITEDSYYRLLQEDYDGTKETIGLVYLSLSEIGTSLSIYPNPTSGSLKIEGAITNYVLTDAMGRNVMSNPYATSSATSEELSSFLRTAPSGVYFLSSRSEGQTETVRIVKK